MSGRKKSSRGRSMHLSPDGVIRKCSNPEACPYKKDNIRIALHKDKQKEQDVLKTANDVFHNELLNLPDDHPAIKDLKDRKIPVTDSHLGWIPGERRALRLLRNAGLNDRDMLEAGVADLSGSGSIFVYTHDRLNISLLDIDGNYRMLYARTYSGHGRKYISSNPASYTMPEYDQVLNRYKEPYHNDLFLIEKAAPEAKRKKEVFITEGQFDALACHYAGIKNTISANGSENFHLDTYEEALDLVDGGKLIMCFDSDGPGIHGMMNVARNFPNANIDVIVLPAGSDPCDIRSKMGDRSLRRMMANHRPMIDVISEMVTPGTALNFMAGMDNDHKEHYASKVSERLGINKDRLISKSSGLTPPDPSNRHIYHECRRWVRMLGLNVQSHDPGASIAEKCHKSERFSVMAGIAVAAHNENREIPHSVKIILPKIFRDPDDNVLKEAEESCMSGSFDEIMNRYHELFDALR